MATTILYLGIPTFLVTQTAGFLFGMEVGEGCGITKEIQTVQNRPGGLQGTPCTLVTFTGRPPLLSAGTCERSRYSIERAKNMLNL